MADRPVFKLYIEGDRPLSTSALRNAREVCEGIEAELQVVDVAKNPEVAFRKRIFRLPLLVREEAAQEERFVGDLSDTEAVTKHFGSRKPNPEDGS